MQLVHEKTGGNPFFAIQFLYALADEALLIFDHADARWSWDLDRIHAKRYTDNVVDLMVAKLDRLPAETRKALAQLACLGNAREFATLCDQSARLAGRPSRQPLGSRSTGLVDARARRLRVPARPRPGGCLFADPRRRCAPQPTCGSADCCVAHTPPTSAKRRSSRSSTSSTAAPRSSPQRDEREQVAELNLIAGKRAKASTAYASALSYFIAGRGTAWRRTAGSAGYELSFELEFNRAECEFLTGAVGAARTSASRCFRHAPQTPSNKATVTCLRIDLYVTLGSE